MQQGVCIDTGLSAILRKDSTYFLREHGKYNYYVSNFENPKSYFGSFQKNYFRLIAEPRRSLRRFVARVSRSYSWYTLGDEYVITEKDHNGYFHVYLRKKPHSGPIGSYLNSFFEIIEPFNEAEKTKVLEASQTDILKVEEGASTIVPDTPKKLDEKEMAKKRTAAEKLEECGQLNLFDSWTVDTLSDRKRGVKMSVDDKVDHVLTWGECVATSQADADKIIKKANEMGYTFVSDVVFGSIMVWSLNTD